MDTVADVQSRCDQATSDRKTAVAHIQHSENITMKIRPLSDNKTQPGKKEAYGKSTKHRIAGKLVTGFWTICAPTKYKTACPGQH